MMRGKKLSKRDMNIVLIFLGVVIVFLSYFLICNHFRTQEDATRAETKMLAPTLTQLQQHQLNLTSYEREVEAAKETIDRLRKLHPDMVLPEEFIQFAVALEADISIDIRSITTHDREPLSSFALPNDGGYPEQHTAYRQSFTFTAILGYDALKETIERIYNASERITLDDCAVTYSPEDGKLGATITVSEIFINNGYYIYEPVPVTDRKSTRLNSSH